MCSDLWCSVHQLQIDGFPILFEEIIECQSFCNSGRCVCILPDPFHRKLRYRSYHLIRVANLHGLHGQMHPGL